MLDTIYNNYNGFMEKYADPRVSGWLLMSGPLPSALLCLSYVYLVRSAGPRFMQHREPYQLRKILVIYNAIQMFFSAFIFYELGMGGWFLGYSFRCQPVDYGHSPMALRMTAACWWYFFSKFTEFFDTFFFILRKKYQHVSTLHVIHHGVMPMSVWFGMKFTPGGHSSFFGFLNSFVHIIMYFYYMVAAMGPEYQKYIWWKRYLTNIQMIQFVFIFGHAFQLIFSNPCNYPVAFGWWIGGHGVMFFILFLGYYKKEYLSKKKGVRSAMKSAVGETCIPNQTKIITNGVSQTNGHVTDGKATNGELSNGYGLRSRTVAATPEKS